MSFAPIGNKKLLLKIKRAKDKGIKNPHKKVLEEEALAESLRRGHSPSKEKPHAEKRDDDSAADDSMAGLGKTTVSSSSNLMRLIKSKDLSGKVTRMLMDSTLNYTPDPGGPLQKAFECAELPYEKFFEFVHTYFRVSFTEDEVDAVVGIFDAPKNRFIDGYDFIRVIVKLNGMRKDKELKRRQALEATMRKEREDEAKRKAAEQVKFMIAQVSFEYNEEEETRTVTAISRAAKKYDQTTPGAKSLKGFEGASMDVPTFREMIARTFGLKFNPMEMGVLMYQFDHKKNSDGTITVDCRVFVRFFLRLGIDLRERERLDMLTVKTRGEEADKVDADKRQREELSGVEMIVDYDFSEADEARSKEKLAQAALKYDQNSSSCLSLGGFDCAQLKLPLFRDLVRRTFNLVLTPKEMGALVRMYDKDGIGAIKSQPFLVSFLKMGVKQRREIELEQVEKNRKGIEELRLAEERKKVELANKSSSAAITPTALAECNFQDDDLASAIQKLQEGSVKYDKARGVPLKAFEARTMKPGLLSDLLRQVFNIHLTLRELAAVVSQFDRGHSGEIDCNAFMLSFNKLGQDERFRMSSERVKKQQELEATLEEEERRKQEEKELRALEGAGMMPDFDFTPADKHSAWEKFTEAAFRYDKTASGAAKLDGFEAAHLPGQQFNNLVKKIFKLVLTDRELGSLVKHFDRNGDGTVHCSEFLNVFFKLGFDHRSAAHREHIIKQREAIREREQAEAKALAERGTTKSIEFNCVYLDKHKDNALEKMTEASAAYDRYHPAAPSLAAFEHGAKMAPSNFKENIRKTFGLVLDRREMAFVVNEFAKPAGAQKKPTKTAPVLGADGLPIPLTEEEEKKKREREAKGQMVDSGVFLTKFLGLGVKERSLRHLDQLDQQRQTQLVEKEHAEMKLQAHAKKLEDSVQIDWNFTRDDRTSAYLKLAEASERFDKNHPSAPSLRSFEYGLMKPGIFKDALRTCFSIHMTPKELGSCICDFLGAGTKDMVDPKLFLIGFMKLGVSARAKTKAMLLEAQRKAEAEALQEQYRKQRLLTQKHVTDVDGDFGSEDRSNAIIKLTRASAKYDKNAPGCVSLDLFVSQYMTPVQFNSSVKSTFNITLTPKELSSMIKEFESKTNPGNVSCFDFVRSFLRYGVEERDRQKAITLEKQRRMNYYRKTEHERKIKELESKVTVEINYDFPEEKETSAFNKLLVAAIKYDRHHPGAVSLEGFNAQTITPGVFRELLKRTFNVTLDPFELGAVVRYFEAEVPGQEYDEMKIPEPNDNTVMVDCKAFLVHFCKVGFSGRDRLRKKQLKQQRDEDTAREREHVEKLAGQWAKTDVQVDFEFGETDEGAGLEKIYQAAHRFDPTNPGPIGLKAFKSADMPSGVFREMIRRSFHIKLTNKELGAVVSHFDTTGKRVVDGKRFVAEFCRIGCARRDEVRIAKLHKNRTHLVELQEETLRRKDDVERKLEVNVDFDFTKKDFTDALGMIRNAAALFDPHHAAAPSLSGFHGSNMTPAAYKDMMYRTFKMTLGPRQLGSLVKFFDMDESNTVDSKEFLNYFHKIHKQEQSKARRNRIIAERAVAEQEKMEEKGRQEEKQRKDAMLMSFTPADEKNALRKIRAGALEIATDGGSYTDSMRELKDRVMSSTSFRDTFNRIFLIKFTLAEVGVLKHFLDPSGGTTLDGPTFYKAFMKLARVEEKVLLGELKARDVRLSLLRPGARIPEGAPKAKTKNKYGLTVSPKKTKRAGGDGDGGGSGSESSSSSSDDNEEYEPEAAGDSNANKVGKPLEYGGGDLHKDPGARAHSRSVDLAKTAAVGSQPMSIEALAASRNKHKKANPNRNKVKPIGKNMDKIMSRFRTDDDLVDENHDHFNSSTVSQSWILPSVAGAGTSVPSPEKERRREQQQQRSARSSARNTGRSSARSRSRSRSRGRGESSGDEAEFLPYSSDQLTGRTSTSQSPTPSPVRNEGAEPAANPGVSTETTAGDTEETASNSKKASTAPKPKKVAPPPKKKVAPKMNFYIPLSLGGASYNGPVSAPTAPAPAAPDASEAGKSEEGAATETEQTAVPKPPAVTSTRPTTQPQGLLLLPGNAETSSLSKTDDFAPLQEIMVPSGSPKARPRARASNVSQAPDREAPLRDLLVDIVQNGKFISNSLTRAPKTDKGGLNRTLGGKTQSRTASKTGVQGGKPALRKSASANTGGFLFPALMQNHELRPADGSLHIGANVFAPPVATSAGYSADSGAVPAESLAPLNGGVNDVAVASMPSSLDNVSLTQRPDSVPNPAV